MSRTHQARNALIGAALLGCSSLPDYAAPRGGVVDPSSMDRSDLITYRALERSDFRAPSPPAEAGEHAKKLGAMTCSYIVTTPGTKVQVKEVRSPDGHSTFSAKLAELSFVAYMDRKCSWWNAEAKGTEDYTLQHEQIHFALTEIAARKLNAEAPAMIAEFQAEGDSAEEVSSRAQAAVQEMIEDANSDLLDRNRDFDEDTSAKHDVAVQQRWADEVAAELGQSSL